MKPLMYSLSFIIATTVTLSYQPILAIDSFYAFQTNERKVQNRFKKENEPNVSREDSFDENKCEMINGKLECLDVSSKDTLKTNNEGTLTKSRNLKNNNEDF